MTNTKRLSQYHTPAWVCDRILELHFADLGKSDTVIEPSCGHGRFLQEIPENVQAIGVEIDEALAIDARARTGRRIILGDFMTVPIDVEPTAIIGNPPFRTKIVVGFLERAHELLPEGGRVGFILPCYVMQSVKSVTEWSRLWSLKVDMIPRTAFYGDAYVPLAFAMFWKHSTDRVLVGVMMFQETIDVQRISRKFRELLRTSRPHRSVWRAVTEAAVEALGGEASLAQIYKLVGGARPTGNQFWREKVRQMAQAHLTRVGDGRYARPERIAA